MENYDRLMKTIQNDFKCSLRKKLLFSISFFLFTKLYFCTFNVWKQKYSKIYWVLLTFNWTNYSKQFLKNNFVFLTRYIYISLETMHFYCSSSYYLFEFVIYIIFLNVFTVYSKKYSFYWLWVLFYFKVSKCIVSNRVTTALD